jgi:hypothetical protein
MDKINILELKAEQNPALKRAVERLKNSFDKDTHANHYTKHTSHSSHSRSHLW